MESLHSLLLYSHLFLLNCKRKPSSKNDGKLKSKHLAINIKEEREQNSAQYEFSILMIETREAFQMTFMTDLRI